MDNDNNNIRKKRDCSGQNNGFFNHKHSLESRKKMAASHRAYQDRIRQQQAPSGMTMAEFLGMNQNLDLKGYIKSLINKEGLIKEIIREEIKKLL